MAKTFEILLVEDNPGDVKLMTKALQGLTTPVRLSVGRDGGAEEAMTYLLKENASLPDLVLLDLNLPKKDGREVLSEIRRHPKLQDLPVVILTTSDAEKDISMCRALKANSYLKKPMSFSEYAEVLAEIKKYCLA